MGTIKQSSRDRIACLVKLGVARLRFLAASTRPVHPDTETALQRRWQELPEPVRTPAQLLGRRSTGCEGTHGVFPRCDLACTPTITRAKPTACAPTLQPADSVRLHGTALVPGRGAPVIIRAR